MQCPTCKYTWMTQCPCCDHSYCPDCHMSEEEAYIVEMELEEAEVEEKEE